MFEIEKSNRLAGLFPGLRNRDNLSRLSKAEKISYFAQKILQAEAKQTRNELFRNACLNIFDTAEKFHGVSREEIMQEAQFHTLIAQRLKSYITKAMENRKIDNRWTNAINWAVTLKHLMNDFALDQQEIFAVSDARGLLEQAEKICVAESRQGIHSQNVSNIRHILKILFDENS